MFVPSIIDAKYNPAKMQNPLAIPRFVESSTPKITHSILRRPKKEKPDADLEKIKANLPRGVSAYIVWIARNHPVTATALLARLLPIQQESTQQVDVVYHSFEEINNRLRELGLPVGRIYPLLEAKPVEPE